ncbi:MAG: MFS transporter, partial [Oscillospiraceae bacterium]|nr:MFS transporter [Oscillospiraceae bacterium]
MDENDALVEQTQATKFVPMKERISFYLSGFLRDMSYATWGNLTRFYIDILGFVGKWNWMNAALPVVEKIYDGVNDPLIGAYFDSRKYGAEKARPFFRTTALPVALGLLCAFLPITFSRSNETANMFLRAAFALLAYMVYEGFQTLNATAHMSLYTSITPNIDERRGIVSRVRLFASGGSGLISGLTP